MFAISKWANRNPYKARVLLVLCHLMAIVNALIFGTLLFLMDFSSSRLIIGVIVSSLCLAYLSYPSLKGQLTKGKYRRKRASDFTMAIAYALLIAFSFNNYLAQPEQAYTIAVPGIQKAVFSLPAKEVTPVASEKKSVKQNGGKLAEAK